MVGLAVIIIPIWLEQEPPVPAPVVQRDMAPMPATELPHEPLRIEPAIEEEISSGLEASSAELAKRVPALQAPPLPAEAVHSSVETVGISLDQAPADSSQVTQTAARPPPTNSAADLGWVIQLGSFTRRENAESLDAKLREAGFTASVEPLETRGKVSYRVRVGSKANRGQAERLHIRLQQELGVSGMLVRGD